MNSRNGITITSSSPGNVDANPEKFLIAGSLDGSRLPGDIQVGDELDTITGIIEWGFGNWRLRPLEVVVVQKSLPNKLDQSDIHGSSCALTIATYNVENMHPTKPSMKVVAKHIVENLNKPDIIALQEIQDDSGVKNNGVVSCDLVMNNLIKLIEEAGKFITN